MRRFLFLIIYLLSSCQGLGSAEGAIYYVSEGDGNDLKNGLSADNAWKTISKVNASSFSPGDSILFRRGDTWEGTLAVSSSGSSGNPITFGTYGSGAKPAIDNKGTSNHAIYNGKSYIIIDGLTLKNAIQNIIQFAATAQKCQILNCDVLNDGTYMSQNGIYIASGSNDHIISHNNVYNIRHVTVSPKGISIYTSGTTVIYNSVYNINNNNSDARGIDLESSNNNIIAWNIVYDIGGESDGSCLELYASSSNAIYKNMISDARSCIEVKAGSNNNIFYYNIIHSPKGPEGEIMSIGKYPLPIGTDSTGNIFYNNVLYHNGISGSTFLIHITSTGNTFKNNIFVRVSEAACSAIKFDTMNTALSNYNTTLDYNIYWNKNLDNLIVADGYHGMSYNLADWKIASGQDAHSLYIDPIFVSEGTDFRTQPSSPAINAGTNVGLALDYAGMPVPIGIAPDIGAYEYNSAGDNSEGGCLSVPGKSNNQSPVGVILVLLSPIFALAIRKILRR